MVEKTEKREQKKVREERERGSHGIMDFVANGGCVGMGDFQLELFWKLFILITTL